MIQQQVKHIIHKLTVDFNTSDHQDELGLKDQSMNFVKEIVLPALEEVLEELDDGRIIRIDQLSLELKQIDKKHFKEDLRQQIIKQFPKKLKPELDQSATKVKVQHTSIETLDFFLSTGTLPWWDTENSIQKIEASVLELIKSQTDMAQKIQSLLRSTNIDRFTRQLSEKFIQAIFTLVKIPTEIWSLIPETQSLLAGHFSSRIVRNEFISSTLILLQNEPGTVITSQDITLLVFKRLEEKLSARSGYTFKSSNFESKELPQNTASKMLKAYTDTKPLNKWDQPKKTSKPSTQQQPDSYYIQNAGLVLLHPFLTYLFEELEYTKNKKFVDEFQQQQAALALQYTLNPKGEFSEHELPLNKILCNIDLDTPIESKLIQSETLRLKTDQLLHSTIQHWPALKNTSVDGLRETFLNRSGKLSLKENGDWKLFVEYKTYDILLSKLSWNYSLIKLPWMTNILWVEWG